MKKTRKSKKEVQEAAKTIISWPTGSEPHKVVEEYGELCQRCGERGEDRRTLWMACFYAMNELGVPFEQIRVTGDVFAYAGEKQLEQLRITVPEFSKEPTGKVDSNFFRLRVCKDCRGDWMAAIKKWFLTPPEQPQFIGSGIFVRENGRNVEITEEEWERRRAARETK